VGSFEKTLLLLEDSNVDDGEGESLPLLLLFTGGEDNGRQKKKKRK
jgi:hypothetical protein